MTAATLPPTLFTCTCGGAMHVYSVRKSAGGSLVLRYRRCVTCKRTTSTEVRTVVRDGELVITERVRPAKAAAG